MDNRERRNNRKRADYREVKISDGEMGQKGNERVSLLCMCVCV